MLWFSPRLRVFALFQNGIERFFSYPEMQSSEIMGAMQFTRDFWLAFLENFNLLIFLRALPVGLPSLMVSRSMLEIPFGTPVFHEVKSVWTAAGISLLLILIGILIGTLYFIFISQATSPDGISWRKSFSWWPWTSVQVLLLSVFVFLLMFIITIPISCFLSVIMLSGLGLERFGFLLMLFAGGILIWWLLPLFFTPHGIFIKHLKLWNSIPMSIRITRSTLPTSGFLILALIVISEGLNFLWRIPAENSWFALVGIVGHSFVAASLIAASFVYYQEADQWINSEIQQTVA